MTVKLKDIEVQWYEGLRLEDYGDSPAFDRWDAFQKFLFEVFDEDQKYRKEKGLETLTYTKVKAEIIWADKTTLIDRIDVGLSEGDFNPNKEFVGDYLRKQNQAMYASDFSTKKPRTDYSWNDQDSELRQLEEEQEYRDNPKYGVDPTRKEAYRQGFLAGIAFIKYWKPSVFEEGSETLDPEWKKRMINAANRETDEWEERQVKKMKEE